MRKLVAITIQLHFRFYTGIQVFRDIFYCFVFFKFSLLSNPEVLRTLRNVEGLMSTQSKQQAELDKIKEMKKEAEFDKHLAQTVQVR